MFLQFFKKLSSRPSEVLPLKLSFPHYKVPMQKSQVLISKLFQEIETTHAICQYRKYLKIDSVFIICNMKQAAVIFIRPDKPTEERIFLSDFWHRLSVFLKEVPEHTASELKIESIKLWQHKIQYLLQQYRDD